MSCAADGADAREHAIEPERLGFVAEFLVAPLRPGIAGVGLGKAG